MGVVAAEAGHDDFAGVSLAVAVSILQKKDVGRIGDPDPSVADGDSRGDIEAVGKDRETVGLAVAVGIFEDLDAIATWSGLAPRVFEAFGDPDPASLVEGHRDGIDDVGLGGDQFDLKARGNGHRFDRLGRAFGEGSGPSPVRAESAARLLACCAGQRATDGRFRRA